jgi:crotonobetainyl-CoA:carnitine CoA-transferase CaiB-like acyl-CoA transferase
MNARLMDGVRVVEVATWAFVPSSAAVLAEWGADVVKIEAEAGDPLRCTDSWGIPHELGGGAEPVFQVVNRGKRSIGLDLSSPAGKAVLLRIVSDADVFVTNFLPAARAKLGIEVADIRSANPGIIYARGSAHGHLGAERDAGGFDAVSYWARSGASRGAMPDGAVAPAPSPGPAFGDTQAGMNLAGGIAAALYHRQRTGQAAVVDTSLLGAGMWAMQMSITATAMMGVDELAKLDRTRPANPIGNSYRTADDGWIMLAMPDWDRYWPGVCHVIDRADLIADPRMADEDGRTAHGAAIVAELDAAFASRPLAWWAERLGGQKGPWSVIQPARRVAADPQALASDLVAEVTFATGATAPVVRVPVVIDEQPARLRRGPVRHEHTADVLAQAGYSTAEIAGLLQDRVVFAAAGGR